MTHFRSYSRSRHCWQPTELVSTLLSASAREVVRHWISSARFLDANNEPTLLLVSGSQETGFGALVGQVSRDLVPAVILSELLRKGIVEQYERGRLMLRRSAYVPDVPLDDTSIAGQEQWTGTHGAFRRRRNDV